MAMSAATSAAMSAHSSKIPKSRSCVKILDGGFSGQLSRHVTEAIDGDPLWTARFLFTDPEAVYNTHLDFLRAGADIIETNTYQASVPGMMRHLKVNEKESIALIKKAASLAKSAMRAYITESAREGKRIDTKLLVAGSCGPYGAYLHDLSEYTGSYGKTVPRKELMDWHRPRIRALLEAGVDVLAFETIPCAEEADALLELLREFPRARAWLSFYCKDDCSIVDGSNFKDTAVRCYNSLKSQILAVGVNCIHPKNVTALLRNINDGRHEYIPLIVYPNRGGCYSATNEWLPFSDDHPLGMSISNWLSIGVRFIGGCCNIFAEDIKAIRQDVDNYYK